jgi:hypothetical protein
MLIAPTTETMTTRAVMPGVFPARRVPRSLRAVYDGYGPGDTLRSCGWRRVSRDRRESKATTVAASDSCLRSQLSERCEGSSRSRSASSSAICCTGTSDALRRAAASRKALDGRRRLRGWKPWRRQSGCRPDWRPHRRSAPASGRGTARVAPGRSCSQRFDLAITSRATRARLGRSRSPADPGNRHPGNDPGRTRVRS